MTERAQTVSEADRDIRAFLVRVAGNVGDYLGDNLTGIYVYGSLAAGSFRRAASDIDVLVVVRRAMNTRDREGLAGVLVALSRARPIAGDLEAYVVTERHARDFVHPMPFEVHYSSAVRDAIETERYDYATPRSAASLALAFSDLRERGVRLVGPEAQSLFALVPWHARINAVEESFTQSHSRIARDPIGAALNGAQALRAVTEREARASSKEDAARWAMGAAPEEFRDALQAALDVRMGNRNALGDADVRSIHGFRRYVEERARGAFERARPEPDEDSDDAER